MFPQMFIMYLFVSPPKRKYVKNGVDVKVNGLGGNVFDESGRSNRPEADDDDGVMTMVFC